MASSRLDNTNAMPTLEAKSTADNCLEKCSNRLALGEVSQP